MTLPLGVAMAGVVAPVSAWCVRTFGHTDRARGLWWLAAVGAAGAVVPASVSAVPVPAALAGAGLMAVLVVDAIEHRIPTTVAHGTTTVSAVALVAYAATTGEWRQVGWAVVLTAGLVLGCLALWLVGGVGFGDVRLAGSLVTAMVGGLAGLSVLVYVAFLVAGATVVIRRLWGRRGGSIPFGPALVAGWLASLAIA